MYNLYRRFLCSAARVLAPLTNILKGPGKSLQWSPTLDFAFFAAKLLLCAVPVFTHPVPGAAVSLDVNVFDSQVGAVLQQRIHVSWSPLAFLSKKLSSAESKYSAFDCELLAAYSAIRHFSFLLEAREFTHFTDHKPLTYALFCFSPPWSTRQTHHLAYISEFTSDIVQVPGSKNVVADTLSRPYSLFSASPSAVPVFSVVSLNLSATDFDFSSLPALQSECASVQSMLSSPSLSVVSVPFKMSSIFYDVSLGSLRLLVPISLSHRMFLSLHGLSHPGVCVSRRLLSSRFMWPCLAKDVGPWTRSCIQCQQSKIPSNIKSSIPSIKVPGRRFFSRASGSGGTVSCKPVI